MSSALFDAQFPGPRCGVDEVGRGCLAGNVVAAAVILPDILPLGLEAHIRDSKTLTAKARQTISDALTPLAICAIGTASVSEIDELNIFHASLLAMQRAVLGLPQSPVLALIDGNKIPPGLPCPAQAIIGGDSKSLCIAAASIVAKVERDRYMMELATRWPGYGWERNAGYGTAVHLKGLREHGVTPHHRRSFAPVAALL
ncbi:MAG: ribonuclease HII [Holosporales bacterium]